MPPQILSYAQSNDRNVPDCFTIMLEMWRKCEWYLDPHLLLMPETGEPAGDDGMALERTQDRRLSSGKQKKFFLGILMEDCAEMVGRALANIIIMVAKKCIKRKWKKD